MDKDNLFFVLTDSNHIGIAHQPNKEEGGCEIIKWLPDEMIKSAYSRILVKELTKD